MAHQEIWESRDSSDIFFSPRVLPPAYVPYHWHDVYEFVYEMEGSTQVTIAKKTYDLFPGKFIAVNPREVHAFMSINGDTSITIIIPGGFFRKYVPNAPAPVFPNVFSDEQNEMISAFLKRCNMYFDKAQQDNLLPFYSELYKFVAYLYEQRLRTAQSGEQILGDTERERLEVITDYVSQHYDEPITLKEAAGILHLHPNYFCRFFKKVTGVSFMQFLNDYRIVKVYKDVIGTNDPIHSILIRHGCYDYKSFRKYFLNRYGATPSVVRKRHTLSEFKKNRQ